MGVAEDEFRAPKARKIEGGHTRKREQGLALPELAGFSTLPTGPARGLGEANGDPAPMSHPKEALSANQRAKAKRGWKDTTSWNPAGYTFAAEAPHSEPDKLYAPAAITIRLQ